MKLGQIETEMAGYKITLRKLYLKNKTNDLKDLKENHQSD